MFKRFFTVVLTILLLTTLVACGNESENNTIAEENNRGNNVPMEEEEFENQENNDLDNEEEDLEPQEEPEEEIDSSEMAEIAIKINGEKIPMAETPYVENGILFAPVRSVAEALNAEVDYNTPAYPGEEMDIYPEDESYLWLTIFMDKSIALVSEGTYRLPAPPTIKNDTVMAPMEFIANYLGCEVNWDEEANIVELNFIDDMETFDAKYFDEEAADRIGDWLVDPNHTDEGFLDLLDELTEE